MSRSRTIPPKLRKQVWETHMRKPRSAYGPCVVCKEEIHILNFECGHVISHLDEGPLTVKNLRPICGSCNKSMGKTNLHEYIERFFSGKDWCSHTTCGHKQKKCEFCKRHLFEY